ncbi:ATPase [Klebsiella variicola]|uniref:ATPase n=1 Tax=Klebsiella variicola TaxID=244366 RepID=A0A7H4M8E7_KLEVA|nr:ATPase [Klebsiella variicola]
MQSLSPTSRYLLALKEGSHQPDDVQQEAVSRLDTIYQELQTQPAPVASGGGLRAKFGKLLGKREPAAERRLSAACICGAAWGGEKPG